MKYLIHFCLILFLFQSQFLFSQNEEKDSIDTITFEMMLDSLDMEFTPPEGFEEVKTIENKQMNYEKAYKHPKKRFEVRYALRMHDFDIHKSIITATLLNISGGQNSESSPFPEPAVQQEFGADGGFTGSCQLGKEFGQDYKYCLAVYIFKKGIGDAYIFYLVDDYELFSLYVEPIFHALKFNIPPPSNCADFKNGKFKIIDEQLNHTSTIERTDSLQVETDLSTGDKMEMKVTWTSDCEYTIGLFDWQKPEDDVLGGRKIYVKIIETGEDYYIFEGTIEGTDIKHFQKMIKIDE